MTSIRVGGVPEHFNYPWRLAVASKSFSTAGIQVTYREYPEGTGEMNRALEAGELDVALVLTEGAVANILQTGNNRLAKIYVDSPLVWGIHVAASSPILSTSEIKERRFAISRHGSGSHLIAIVDAAERGWSTSDMAFVVVNNIDGAREALKNADADVFLWERHTTQPLVDSGEFRRVGERAVPWPAFAVSARLSFLQANGQHLRSALDIVARHARNLKRRKSAVAELAKTYGLEESGAATWLQSVHWSTGYRRPVSALSRIARVLQNQGIVAHRPFEPSDIWFPL